MSYEKIVVVTRKTRLEELIGRFNSRAQAKFYIEHAGGDFSDYEREAETYRLTVDRLVPALESIGKTQRIDRGFVPSFLFSPRDLVVTIGQDGLVANTAKYVAGQPIIAVNPDPERFDGVLLPFLAGAAPDIVARAMKGNFETKTVVMAEARLKDGQRLLAFNDLFVGAKTHVSARYEITFNGKTESQSSSGIIISTGAGSTGWLSSIFNMARQVTQFSGEPANVPPLHVSWDEPRLVFVVREPFLSRASRIDLAAGYVTDEEPLVLESRMAVGGTIFSDGVESDFLQFNAGALARIATAPERAMLVVG